MPAAVDPFVSTTRSGEALRLASLLLPASSLPPVARRRSELAEVDPLSLLGLEGKKTPLSERPARR